MFQLSNYLQKVVVDINDNSQDPRKLKNTLTKEIALKKSKNMSKCLSLIYGFTNKFRF